jgi:putative phage-type endonuclease
MKQEANVKMSEKVLRLKEKPQPVQRTPEWYKQRQTRITASEAASCLKKSENVCKNYVEQFNIAGFKYKENEALNPYESREDYIIKKCDSYRGKNNFKDNVFTLWGKKYEEVANRLYMQLKGVMVHEFGLISHDHYEWLAASPDGITDDGVMLEIKCPKSRKINQEMIPLYYWVQVQIQLETCDLDECDFLECEIVECADEASWRNAIGMIKEGEKKAFGLLLCEKTENGTEPKHKYPPVDIVNVEQYTQWVEDNKDESDTVSYYVISKYHITNIKRSKEWFENVKKEIKETWDLIRRLQENEEDFSKYKNSIHLIKSKRFYERFHSTICEIDTEESIELNDEQSSVKEAVETSSDTCRIDYTECLID